MAETVAYKSRISFQGEFREIYGSMKVFLRTSRVARQSISLPPSPLAFDGFVDIAKLYDVIDRNCPPVFDQRSAFIVLGERGGKNGTALTNHDETRIGHVEPAPVAHVNPERSEGVVVQTI
jgi:hypothetical protein